jgi:ABC-type multidrug transport system ATPase subunit
LSEGVYGKLLVIAPDRSRREVLLNQPEFWIGSDPQAELSLPAPGVGGAHAVIRATGQGVQLQTGEAVTVNQQPVRQHKLEQGDVICVGPYMLVYHSPRAALVATPGTRINPAKAASALEETAKVEMPPPAYTGPSGALKPPPGAAPGVQTATGVALVVYTPTGNFSYPLEPGHLLRLGSAPESEIALTFAAGIKPLHARIEWEGSAAVLVEPDKQGEVQVNGQATIRHVLSNGDFIKLGEARMAFHDARALEGGHAPLQHVVSGTLSRSTIGQIVKLGRDPQNDISLNHIQVSRYHAEIHRGPQGYTLVDLGSTNGTFLNSQRIQGEVPLRKDDRIRISDFNFYFDGDKLEHFSEEGNARIDAINLRRVVANNKVILHDVSLSIYPREFVALVGVSGAGKSTLMNALSGFQPADQGTVLMNGIDYYAHFESFRSTLGYVPQDDIIHKELTVYRALYYAACLRMPDDTTPEEIEQRLEDVMRDLHLSERRDTPINRLSGGQRKRVSIGVELITRPRLFYLDEPTSGLDPGMETEMMRIFRHLADKGHTVILITHATKNINLCDKVVFLAEGGHLAFFGSPAEALEYFDTPDFTDIYLKLENEKTPEVWDKEYRASVFYKRNVVERLKEVNSLVDKARGGGGPHRKDVGRGLNLKTSMRQFAILTRRYIEIMVRDQGNLALLLGFAPVCAMLMALAFSSNVLGHFNPDEYNIPGFFNGARKLDDLPTDVFMARLMTFFFMLMPIFFGLFTAIREITKEFAVYKRERTVNLQILPYVGSKIVVLALICLVQIVIFLALVVLRFQFPDASGDLYLRLFLVLYVSEMAAMAMALACSAIVSNENKAISAMLILLVPQILLTGSLPKLEWPAKIVSYFGLTKWSFEIMGNLTRVWEIFPSAAQAASKPGLANALQKLADQGVEYQQSLDIEYWRHLGMLGLFFVVFISLTCAFLLGKDELKR